MIILSYVVDIQNTCMSKESLQCKVITEGHQVISKHICKRILLLTEPQFYYCYYLVGRESSGYQEPASWSCTSHRVTRRLAGDHDGGQGTITQTIIIE